MPGEAAPEPVPAWACKAIIAAGRRMDRRGWVPATAGNISLRLDARRIAITRSGGHKGMLDAGGVMQVDLDGQALTPAATPSAECLLHCQLYRASAGVGAVLHGHSVAATVLSLHRPGPIRLAGYELLKMFGLGTHDAVLDLPVFDNDQDIPRLAAQVAPWLAAQVAPWLAGGRQFGYLIRGHGVYVWGPDMAGTMARLEGLEFLLECELERRKLER